MNSFPRPGNTWATVDITGRRFIGAGIHPKKDHHHYREILLATIADSCERHGIELLAVAIIDDIGAIAAGTELVIISNAHSEGSGQPQGRVTSTFELENDVQIVFVGSMK